MKGERDIFCCQVYLRCLYDKVIKKIYKKGMVYSSYLFWFDFFTGMVRIKNA